MAAALLRSRSVWLLIFSFSALVVLADISKSSQDEETCSVDDGTCETKLPNNNNHANKEDNNNTNNKDGGKSSIGRGSDDDCKDHHENCNFWADLEPSECDKNTPYMLQTCRQACGWCNDDNKQQNDTAPTTIGGEPQRLVPSHLEAIQQTIVETERYMQEVVFVDPKYIKVKKECKNRHEDCSHWKVLGECAVNPGYMNVQCAPTCQSCELILMENRCPLDPNAPNAWKPGDLNSFFEKIAYNDEFLDTYQFQPKVLSRPKELSNSSITEGTSSKENKDYQIGPWVVVLDNFLSPSECDRLIELGYKEVYERSADVGKKKFDGSYERNINDGRTSRNAWCQHECYEDPIAKTVMERIENTTEIPEPNSEFLQLLKYEEGQYYRTHHDYIDSQEKEQMGPRLITVFLYLNDEGLEGGGTDFPDLKLTVQPKRGSALIWPSVLDQNPNKKDSRTMHQALPVIKGRKFAANGWVHMRDFKTPNTNGC